MTNPSYIFARQGGGALELLGTWTTDITNANDDQALDLGFDWPTDTDWLAITPKSTGTAANTGATFLQHLPSIRALNPGTVGTQLDDGNDERVQLNDQGLTGSFYLGRTSTGRALLEVSGPITGLSLAFYRYVP